MAIEEQKAVVPMKIGQDQATNVIADPAGLIGLTNIVFDQDGATRQRNGFVRELSFTKGGEMALVAHGKTLGILNSAGMHNYEPLTQAFSTSSPTGGPSVTSEVLTNYFGDRDIKFTDIAVLGNVVAVVTGEHTTDGDALRLRLIDKSNGFLLADAAISTTQPILFVNSVCVAAVSGGGNNKFLIAVNYRSLTTLLDRTELGNANASLTGTTTVVSLALVVPDSFVYIDLITLDGGATAALVSIATATTFVGLRIINSAGTITATSAGVSPAIANSQIAVAHIGAVLITAIYAAGTGVARIESWDPVTAVENGTGANSAVAAGSTALALDIVKTTSTTFRVLINRLLTGAFPAILSELRTEPWSLSGTTPSSAGTAAVVTNVVVTGRPLLHSTFGQLVLTHSMSGLLDGQLAYQISNPVTGVLFSNVAQDDANVLDTNNFIGAVSYRTRLIEDSGGILVAVLASIDTAIARGRVIKVTAGVPIIASTRQGAFLSGNRVRAYDESTLRDGSFVSGPTAPTLTQGAFTGSGIGIGVYGYVVVLTSSDRQGNLKISAPSLTSSITITAINRSISITLYNDVMTGAGSRVLARVYRTAANGSTYSLQAIVNVQYMLSETYLDIKSDATIAVNEPLYTDSGELASGPSPSCRALWVHRNRLWAVRSEDPQSVAYTKELREVELPQWSSELTKRVEIGGGELVGGGTLGERLVIFQQTRTLVMSGPGPTDLGTANGDGFTDPEVTSFEVGLSDPHDVVQGPRGLIFRTAIGVHALGMDGSISYIGQGVQDSERLIGATSAMAYLPSLHQVWLAGGNDSRVLVFDTRFGRWSEFTGPWAPAGDTVVGIAEVSGVPYVLTIGPTNSALWRYDAAKWRDEAGANTAVVQTIRTPWFRGAGHGGHQRVWRVLLDAELLSAAATVAVSTYTVAPGRAASKTPNTTDHTWTWDLTGTPLGPLELSMRPTVQRCSAFRVDITITPSATSNAERLRLADIGYLFGVIKQVGRGPALPGG